MRTGFSCYLDLLRFMAALLVLLDHLVSFRAVSPALAQWMPQWGREAVVIFFVLSGFVIAYAAQARPQGLAHYAAARAARLYSVSLPALLLAFGLAGWMQAGMAHALADAYEVRRWYLYLPFHALYLGELWRVSETPVWLAPYWSLGYEAWYYALFGAVFFLRGGRRIAVAALLLLIMGYKLWLLLPVWASGVLLWRCHARWPLRPGVARAGMLLSLLLLLLYTAVQGEMFLRTLAQAHWPWTQWPLGSADRVLGDYAVALLVLLNFHCALHARLEVSATLAALGRRLAFYTFPLYLAHGLVLSAWLALRPAARDGAELVPMLAAVVLLTWGLGRLSDPLRDRIERGLLWLSGRLSARVLQGQPGRLGK